MATLSLVADVIFLSDWIFGEKLNIQTIQQVCVPAIEHAGYEASSLMSGGDPETTGYCRHHYQKPAAVTIAATQPRLLCLPALLVPA